MHCSQNAVNMFMFLAVVSAVAAAGQALENPVVNTTQGQIQGYKVADENYYAFYGIHYAGSVSGGNRFKVAPPPPTYTGVFVAVNNEVICAQPTSRGLIGVEDCLTLNIFTPNLTASQPVLVWIQGEEFTTSDPTIHSFKNFMNENIVVVKINYRLSIFGFLCLGVQQAPGNAGLKDVVQGLKWVKENIAGFGGDPNNIVLFGHGSGAAMVDLITLSPMAENLVHKAIVQSGSALSPGAIAYDPVGYAEALGKKLGYVDKTKEELANLLTTTDINELVSALTAFELFNNTALFSPCIENDVDKDNVFLKDAPINILRSGNYSHVPYIAGFTDKEGTIRAYEAAYNQWLDSMEENFEDFIQVDLDLASTSQANKTALVNSIREFYFGNKTINMEVIENYLDYHGDTMILVSIARGVRERANTSTAEVRLYNFGYLGTYNSNWAFPEIPLTGVMHGGILNYLLNFDLKPNDVDTMQRIIQRYSTFIRTGSPNFANSVTWLPVSNIFYYLSYSGGETSPNVTVSSETLLSNPQQQTITFWDEIYSNYYKTPSPVSSSAQKVISLVVTLIICQLLAILF